MREPFLGRTVVQSPLSSRSLFLTRPPRSMLSGMPPALPTGRARARVPRSLIRRRSFYSRSARLCFFSPAMSDRFAANGPVF
jgi:hypothetical protein